MDTRPTESDATIIQRVIEGDSDAFAVLVERYNARLFGLAFHLCGDYDTASDLTQETLVSAYNSLNRIRDPQAFAGWLSSILRNKFRNMLRSKKVSSLSLDRMMEESGYDPPAPDAEPETTEEDLRRVTEYVASLPEKYREVLRLRYADDLSYKEMSAFLKLPETTVATRLRNARQMLIKTAKKDGMI